MLPKSGTISMDMICTEFGVDPVLVELGSKALRDICGKSSGDISLSDFYGLGSTRDYYFWVKYEKDPKYTVDYFGHEYHIDTSDPYYKNVFGDIGISGQKRMNFGFSGVSKLPMFHYEMYATFPSICSPNNMQWIDALDLINYGVTDGGVYIGAETYKKYDITVPQYNSLVADAGKWIPCSVKIPVDYFSKYNITLQRGTVVYPHPMDPKIVHPHAPKVEVPSVFDAFGPSTDPAFKIIDLIIKPEIKAAYGVGYYKGVFGAIQKAQVDGVSVDPAVLEIDTLIVYENIKHTFYCVMKDNGVSVRSVRIQILGTSIQNNTVLGSNIRVEGGYDFLANASTSTSTEISKGLIAMRLSVKK